MHVRHSMKSTPQGDGRNASKPRFFRSVRAVRQVDQPPPPHPAVRYEQALYQAELRPIWIVDFLQLSDAKSSLMQDNHPGNNHREQLKRMNNHGKCEGKFFTVPGNSSEGEDASELKRSHKSGRAGRRYR